MRRQQPDHDTPGDRSPSLTERVVLAVLVEGPGHGFALARELRADGDLGRIMTVRRPLVYRALDRLRDGGLVRATTTEQGDAGPNRVVHRATATGRRVTARWLEEPVPHVRDLRVEFLIKLRLRERRGLDLGPVIDRQRAELGDRLHRLGRGTSGAGPVDVVERWRHHNARAVEAFLDDLASAHRGRSTAAPGGGG